MGRVRTARMQLASEKKIEHLNIDYTVLKLSALRNILDVPSIAVF